SDAFVEERVDRDALAVGHGVGRAGAAGHGGAGEEDGELHGKRVSGAGGGAGAGPVCCCAGHMSENALRRFAGGAVALGMTFMPLRSAFVVSVAVGASFSAAALFVGHASAQPPAPTATTTATVPTVKPPTVSVAPINAACFTQAPNASLT